MDKKVVILGAGITGLACGMKLAQSKKFWLRLIEREDTPGGLCRSFNRGGFRFDYGPHKLYPQQDYIRDELKDLLGENLLRVPKKSSIYLMGNYLNYPLRMKELIFNLPSGTIADCFFDYLKSLFKRKRSYTSYQASYHEWLASRFGEGVYKLVFAPYAKKLWADPDKLSGELARLRVAIPGLKEVLLSLLKKSTSSLSWSASEFYYPRQGIGQLPQAIASQINSYDGKILINQEISQIDIKGKRIYRLSLKDRGTIEGIDFLVSTIPLNELLKLFNPPVPEKILRHVEGLKLRDLILAYFIIKQERLLDKNWIFFPEKDFWFNRISEQKNFSPYVSPLDKTCLCVEITSGQDDPIWHMEDHQLFKELSRQLEIAELAIKDKVEEFFTLRIPQIYPIFYLGYQGHLEEIFNFLEGIENLFLIGRRALFSLANMDHCFDMGITLAEELINNPKPNNAKRNLRKRFLNYVIVD